MFGDLAYREQVLQDVREKDGSLEFYWRRAMEEGERRLKRLKDKCDELKREIDEMEKCEPGAQERLKNYREVIPGCGPRSEPFEQKAPRIGDQLNASWDSGWCEAKVVSDGRASCLLFYYLNFGTPFTLHDYTWPKDHAAFSQFDSSERKERRATLIKEVDAIVSPARRQGAELKSKLQAEVERIKDEKTESASTEAKEMKRYLKRKYVHSFSEALSLLSSTELWGEAATLALQGEECSQFS